MYKVIILFLAIVTISAKEKLLVQITQEIPYIEVKDSGVDIRISRIQDTGNKLTDDFVKTSRVCPPFCVQKITPIKGVKTIAELELIDFIENRVYKKKGLLVDARLKKLFLLETIPGAINIPFTIALSDSKKVKNTLFNILGATKNKDGSYDFSKAKELAVFCNGIWCEQSPIFIKAMVEHGYPKEKLYYYRSGMQGWKLLGLTTVVHKAKRVEK